MKHRCRCSAGFTLLEVLVALAIVAVALAAGSRLTGNAIGSTHEYRERLLAQWVASNLLAEAQVDRLTAQIGETQGEADQGGRKFLWKKRVSTTPNPRFRRVDIAVSAPQAPGHALATVSGFTLGGG